MSAEALANDLELCERENSHLRRHLLWAAAFLAPAQRRELAERIRRRETAVVADDAADAREQEVERDRAIEALVDHVQAAVERGADDAWIGKADHLAFVLRGFLRPRENLTFHELLNPEVA